MFCIISWVPGRCHTLVLNIPLFIAGIRPGRASAFDPSGHHIAFGFIDLIKVPALTSDSLLASIYGGFLMGLGLGIIFHHRGTDLLRKSFINISRQFPLPGCFLPWISGGSGSIPAPGPSAGFMQLCHCPECQVIDLGAGRPEHRQSVFIISDHAEAISERIIREMERGPPCWRAGCYTGLKKCNSMRGKAYTNYSAEGHDQRNHAAFVLVADVREVMGEGF